ncbi:hypothetical protein CP8484711_0165B, partial [Chlamydia psittaci 84-8471/1]
SSIILSTRPFPIPRMAPIAKRMPLSVATKSVPDSLISGGRIQISMLCASWISFPTFSISSESLVRRAANHSLG